MPCQVARSVAPRTTTMCVCQAKYPMYSSVEGTCQDCITRLPGGRLVAAVVADRRGWLGGPTWAEARTWAVEKADYE